MNYLGYNKDNFVEGDSGIDNGTLRINDYILPSVAGASGDVLTMDANGQNTSFQPIPEPASTIEKPIQNLLTMLTPRTSYTIGNADPYFLSISGSEVVDTTDFEVGDVIRVRVEGYYVNNATNPTTTPCTITHQWFINMPNTSPSNETLSSPVQFFGSGGNWFNEVIITWESASSVRITFNGKINYNTGGALSDEVRALNWFVGGSAPPGTERPKSAGSPYYIYPPPTSLQIRGQNRTDIGAGYAIATNYYMDKMNVNALVSGGGVPTIDHLTLSNLNVASGSGDVDAGHSTLVCLDGRAGGQQIIGGRGSGTLILKSNDTTPLLNNIELGSGLDTKIHKIFSNSVASPLVIEHESAIDKIDLRINNNNKVEIKDTEIQLNEDLNLNNNSLLNALGLNTQFLLATSQIETSLIVGLGVGPLPITSNDLTLTENNLPGGEYMNFNNVRTLSYKPLDMNSQSIDNVNVLTAIQVNTDTIENSGSGFLTFTNLGSYTPSFTSSGLDMNDAELLSVNNIRTNIQPILTINKNGSNATEIYGNSTIRRIQVSNAVYLLPGTNLECGTNDINDCGNLNVNTINNLTPVGGLSSSTSNSAILTASTAEQSILGLSFVGSRIAPANTFKQGDAYTATLAGNFSSNNGDTLTLRLKGGATGTTLLSSIAVPLNASTNKYFELEINFVVRQIGAATTADLAINYDFSYNQNSGGNFQGERLCEANNTTFDTTIDNQLDITAQFSSTSANNSIETILSTLGKTL